MNFEANDVIGVFIVGIFNKLLGVSSYHLGELNVRTKTQVPL